MLHPVADREVRRVSARAILCTVSHASVARERRSNHGIDGFPATRPTPRRTPPTRSRTVSPRPLPSWRLPRIFVAPTERTVASPPAPRAVEMRPHLQGLSPREGPYHRSPFPAFEGLSSLGFVPLQGPSTDVRPKSHAGGRRPLSGCCVQTEHNPCASIPARSKSRARGADSASTAPIRTRNLRPDGRAVEVEPGAMGRTRAAPEDAAGDPCVPTRVATSQNGRVRTVTRSSAQPRAVPAPERTDLRTVASARPRRKNESFALPDDEPVGIPPPLRSVRADRLPGSLDRPMGGP